MDYQNIKNNKSYGKYYTKRYTLFSKFDDGILLDKESWYSVTPEKIAEHIALKCIRKLKSPNQLVIDAFCGCGGNSIQFAKYFTHVIANDIDTLKLINAKNNVQIYSVDKRVEFLCCDYEILFDSFMRTSLKPNLIFISPPWGGIQYSRNSNKQDYDLFEKFPINLMEIFKKAIKLTENIVLFLPRNSNLKQICLLAGPGRKFEIEQNFLDSKLVALSVYFGDLVD
jgi:trimethylguanosine synthase